MVPNIMKAEIIRNNQQNVRFRYIVVKLILAWILTYNSFYILLYGLLGDKWSVMQQNNCQYWYFYKHSCYKETSDIPKQKVNIAMKGMNTAVTNPVLQNLLMYHNYLDSMTVAIKHIFLNLSTSKWLSWYYIFILIMYFHCVAMLSPYKIIVWSYVRLIMLANKQTNKQTKQISQLHFPYII